MLIQVDCSLTSNSASASNPDESLYVAELLAREISSFLSIGRINPSAALLDRFLPFQRKSSISTGRLDWEHKELSVIAHEGKKVIEAHIVLSTVVMMMDKSLWGLKEGWENIPGTTLRVRKIQTFFNLIVFYFF